MSEIVIACMPHHSKGGGRGGPLLGKPQGNKNLWLVTALGRILQLVEQQRSEKTSVLGLYHACMRMLRSCLAHHVIHTLPFLLQESTQEQTRTSSLVPVTALGRILQPDEQQRSEKTSVLWLLPCMHEFVVVVLGTP